MSATALPQAVVSALPPRSLVRSVRSASVRSIASTIDLPASFSPRCSSIIAPDQIAPIGLAMPCPAMSGAEVGTGSNTHGKLPPGVMLPGARESRSGRDVAGRSYADGGGAGRAQSPQDVTEQIGAGATARRIRAWAGV